MGFKLRTALVVALVFLGGCAAQQKHEEGRVINIIALNDFHGYIQPSPYSYPDPDNPGETITVQAGGIAALSGAMRELRQAHPDLLFIAAGDLIGASPPISQMFADEPSLIALDMLGLDLSSIGNHELDEGKAELYRQVGGGCESPRPDKACQFRASYPGTTFDYIAANLIDQNKEATAFAPYLISEQKGVKIAFVGAVVENLDTLIPASSMTGLSTLDEADAINAAIPEIADEADVIIAVVHEGGFGHAGPNDCANLSGPIVDIAERLDSRVDVLVTGHTHRAYICQIGDLLVTQGHHYGHLLTHLQITMSGDNQIENIHAKNILVDPERFVPEPSVATFEADLVLRTSNVLNRPIAKIGATSINRQTTTAGECAMGNLVADAQLAATQAQGVQIAMMNYGGIRSDLLVDSLADPVTYTQVAAVHPFKGTLQIVALTGAQIKAILEQQWPEDGNFNPLQISQGFSYSWDAVQPRGQRVIENSLRLNGELIKPAQVYQVAASAFLVDGGDHFKGFSAGVNRRDSRVRELIALIDYLQLKDDAGSPAGNSQPEGRVTRLN